MAKIKQDKSSAVARKPGRSRFTIPRKDDPQIDGSYLDHLFADFQQQSTTEFDDLSTRNLQLSPFDAISPTSDESSLPRHTSQFTTADEPQTIVSTFLSPSPSNSTNISKIKSENLTNYPLQNKTSFLNTTSLSPITENDQFLRFTKQFRLAKGEISVLQIMLGLSHKQETDTCYIKIPQLSQAVQLSHRHTQRILLRLQEVGFIQKLSDYSNVDQLGTLFRLTLPF